jgi:MFS family permease
MKPFTIFILTPLYMIFLGATRGGLLGCLTGSLIFPLFGTAIGAYMGFVAGTIMGAILGIFYALLSMILGLQGLFRFRQWIIRLAGLAGVVLFVIVVDLILDEFYRPFTLMLMLCAVVAGVTTAYGTVRWFDWLEAKSQRKLKIEQQDHSIRFGFSQIFTHTIRSFMGRLKWLFYLTPIAALVIITIHFSNDPPQADYVILHYAAHAVLLTVGLMIGLLVIIYGYGVYMAAFIAAANRLYFKADVHPLAYKNRLSVMAFFVTLFSTPIVTGFIGAPIAAIIATLAVRDYADWYNETSGKGKRKEKPKHDQSLVQQVSS